MGCILFCCLHTSTALLSLNLPTNVYDCIYLLFLSSLIVCSTLSLDGIGVSAFIYSGLLNTSFSFGSSQLSSRSKYLVRFSQHFDFFPSNFLKLRVGVHISGSLFKGYVEISCVVLLEIFF